MWFQRFACFSARKEGERGRGKVGGSKGGREREREGEKKRERGGSMGRKREETGKDTPISRCGLACYWGTVAHQCGPGRPPIEISCGVRT